MTDHTAFWKAVHEAFDPLLPVQDPALRAERNPRYNPMSDLDERLRLPIGHMVYGVVGGVGSGKSTELLAAAGRLTNDTIGRPTAGTVHRPAPPLVVYFDLWQHFEGAVKDPGALDHLQPWELLGLIGLATVRAATERFGHVWQGEPDALGNALDRLRPSDSDNATIDVLKLASGMAVVAGGAAGGATIGAGLKALEVIKGATTWRWRIGGRNRERTSDQDRAVREVLNATNGIVQSVASSYERKLVIMVDGLDRVSLSDTFEDLFVESSLLHELECDVVASMDLALTRRFHSRLRVDQIFPLANVPVARADMPSDAATEGVAFFSQLVHLRLARLGVPVPDDVFAPDRLTRLAWCSAGRLRDFMRLVREVAVRGLMHPDKDVTDDDIEAVVDAERRHLADGLNAGEIEVLQAVLDDPSHRLPPGETALNLLERHLLLPYPNKDTWYLPHTLLTLSLLKTDR